MPKTGLIWALAAALMGLVSLSTSWAQDDEDVVTPDPPDKIYGMGARPSDASELAQVPRFKNFRNFLPPRVDLTDRLPKPGDQGEVGSCVSWAVGYAARAYYTNVFEGRPVSRRENIPSPGYLYHLARQKVSEGGRCKQGSTVYDTIELLKAGAVSLSAYPYDRTDKCQSPPSESVIASATDFKVNGFTTIDSTNLEDIRGKLSQGNPVIISFRTSKPFHLLRGSQTYRDPAYSMADSPFNGWHAMTLIGYDDGRQAFRLINSWGRGWGDRGYAWLSYDLFQTHVREAYVLEIASPPDPPTPNVEPPPDPDPSEPAPTPPDARQKLDLKGYSCAKLQDRSGSGVQLIDGFVSSDADLASLTDRANKQASSVKLGKVFVAPWPQCEALLTLDRALGNGAKYPTIDIGGKSEFQGGEPFPIRIKSPSELSYIYISYIQADGSVMQLSQPRGLVPTTTLPNQGLTFGDGHDGRQKFTVGGPFGREMIIVIATRSPLFDVQLPDKQTDREYLSALRRALIYKPDPKLPDREMTAAISTLTTREATK